MPCQKDNYVLLSELCALLVVHVIHEVMKGDLNDLMNKPSL